MLNNKWNIATNKAQWPLGAVLVSPESFQIDPKCFQKVAMEIFNLFLIKLTDAFRPA